MTEARVATELHEHQVPQSGTCDVFLSYNRSDAPIVTEIARALRSRGLRVFFDLDRLPAGQEWPALLEKHLCACRAAVICLGPHGLGSWQQREQAVALDRQVREPSFPVIPLLLPGVLDPPLGFLRLQTWVDLTDGLEANVLDELEAAVRGNAPGGDARPDPRAQICPYRGLDPFREEDAPFFVGREAFTETLIDKVGKHSLVGVVGPSGSGKSSVVMAGLVPALRRRKDSRVWDIGLMRPGRQPLRQLAAVFLPPDPLLDEFTRIARLKERAQHLASGAVTLRDVVEESLSKQPGTGRFLLVVDQWEELYTQAGDADGAKEREDFVRVLEGARGAPLAIVLTLRADFFGRALENRALADQLQDALVTISPMDQAELRQAITQPAEKAGLRFEPGLVDQILSDVGREPGNLPLLEFLLKELWDRRQRDGQLTFAAYAATGGVRRAIAERAEREFNRLTPPQQETARRFLIRLVTPGEGREDTRARVAIPRGDAGVREVINRFAQARLLTTGLDPGSGTEVVEVGHEALIREWDSLKLWVDADREFLRTVERVKGAMRAWMQEGDDKSDRLLPAGRPLEEARELLARPDSEIEDIKPYIQASVARQQARTVRRRALAAVISTAILSAAGIIVWQAREAARQANENALVVAKAQAETEHALVRVARERDAALASSIWVALEFAGDVLTESEVEALWRLALSELSVVEAFWSQLPQIPNHIARLSRGSEKLLRTAGLHASRRSELASGALWVALARAKPSEVASIVQALADHPHELTAEQSARASTAVLEAMQTTPDSAAELVKALKRFVVTPTPAQAATVGRALLNAISATPYDDLTDVSELLSAAVHALEGDQVAGLLEQFINTLRSSREARQFQALERALNALMPKLRGAQPGPVARAVVEVMQRSVFVSELALLTSMFQIAAGKLERGQVNATAQEVLGALDRSTDSDQAEALAKSLESLAPQLDRDQLSRVLDGVLQVLETTRASRSNNALARAGQAMVAQLDAGQSDAILAKVIQTLRTESNWGRVDALVEISQRLAAKLDRDQSVRRIEIVIPLLPEVGLVGQVRALARVLVAIVPNLDQEQADRFKVAMLQEIKQTNNPFQVEALTRSLAALPLSLTAEEATMVRQAVIRLLAISTQSLRTEALANAFRALPIEPPPHQVSSAVSNVLAQMQKTTNAGDLRSLSETTRKIAPNLEREDGAAALKAVLRALEFATQSQQVLDLAFAAQNLDVDLTSQQAATLVEAILKAIPIAYSNASLAPLFRRAADQFRGEQTEALLRIWLQSLSRARDDHHFKQLGHALEALIPKLSHDQASAATIAVLDAMRQHIYSSTLAALLQVMTGAAPALDQAGASAAYRLVLKTLPDTRDTDQIEAFTAALDMLSGSVDARLAGESVPVLLGLLRDHTSDRTSRKLAGTLAAVVSKLARTSFTDELIEFFRTAKRKVNDGVTELLVRQLERDFAQLSPQETGQHISRLRKHLAEAGNAQLAFAVATALSKVVVVLPESEHAALVLEALRYPTVAGRPSEPLLASLKRIGLAQAARLGDVPAYLQKRFPSLDVAALPVRP